MTMHGLLLPTFSLGAFRVDELGGIVHRQTPDFLTLSTKERCTSAGIAGVTARTEGAHPVLVSESVFRPVLACQECQSFGAVTLTCCDLLGARGFDSLVGVPHPGIGFCSPPGDLCSPLG